jgi:hypothetical protein
MPTNEDTAYDYESNAPVRERRGFTDEPRRSNYPSSGKERSIFAGETSRAMESLYTAGNPGKDSST